MTRLILVFILLVTSGAWAQNSVTLTYQGTLADAGGQAISGVRAVTFRLYDQAEGGEALWTEVHAETDVVDGMFNSVLGLRSGFGDGVMGAERLYLGVQVGDDVEMTPRMRVGGALKAQWAAVAAHAEDVRGEDIHPASVTIGNLPVINAEGQWVGDPVGLRGPAGPAGDPGAPGAPGANGADGRAGRDGADGRPGRDGRDGVDGQPGRDGVDGQAGAAGRDFDPQADADDDGFPDWIEILVGSEPSDGADRPADADEDGVPDVLRGVDGAPGAVGAPGEPGATITEATLNDAGELVLTTSDGRTLNAGNARGAQGSAGVGVDSVEIDEDGDLIVALSNGERVNAGRARGVDGQDGQDAERDSPLTNIFNEAPRTAGDGADIPRAIGAGVDVPLLVDYNGVITDISVFVDVTHPDINRLRLTLIAPDATPYVIFNGANEISAENLQATFPGDRDPVDSLQSIIDRETSAAGRWVLRAVDTDDADNGAVRRVNSWGLNITRRADDAWRLPTNLVVDGAVDAQTLCRIQQLVQNGQPVPGAITLTCGNQDPVRLTTFQCGNGRIDPAETCDDGNFEAGDGCDPRCLSECGNGRLDANEACDDGNQAPNDDCTDACEEARCGDNIIWLGNEQCDDGEANSDEPGADCRTDCTTRRCGDGVRDPGEECDDGNRVDEDECTNECADAICGDGIVGPGEACDDNSELCNECSVVAIFEFTEPGNVVWTAPEDVTEVKVTVIGGGGGGGAGGGGTCGGGGGGYAVGIYEVQPGAIYPVVVGEGGSLPDVGHGYLYEGGETSRFNGDMIYATGGEGCGNQSSAKDGGQGFNGTISNLPGGAGAAPGQPGGDGATGGGGGYPSNGQRTPPGLANQPFGGDGGFGAINDASREHRLSSNAQNYGGGGGGGYGWEGGSYGAYCNGAGGYVRIEAGTF